jgi:hypothetical protein
MEAAAAAPADEAKVKAANDAAADAIVAYPFAESVGNRAGGSFDGPHRPSRLQAPRRIRRRGKDRAVPRNVAGVTKVNNMMRWIGASRRRRITPSGQSVEDLQGAIWRCEQVHEDLRGEYTDAAASRQDLSGAGAAHPAALELLA